MEEARRDGVHADPPARPRHRELARQADQPGLGRGVRRVVRPLHRRVHAGDRGDVDDAAPLPRQHVSAGGLREEERAGQVDVDHLLPLRQGHVLRLRRPGDAGVVHEDVDPAVGGDRLVHDRLDVGRPGHIAEGAFDLEPLLAHRGNGRREPFLASGAEHERGAGFRETFGHLPSDSARSAGDDRDTAVESEQFADGRHVVRLILPTR